GTKNTWIERCLLLDDGDLDLDNMNSETPKTDRRKSERRIDPFNFTADDPLIRLGAGAGVRAENEFSEYLSINPMGWETFKEMNARVHFNDASKRTINNVKRT